MPNNSLDERGGTEMNEAVILTAWESESENEAEEKAQTEGRGIDREHMNRSSLLTFHLSFSL